MNKITFHVQRINDKSYQIGLDNCGFGVIIPIQSNASELVLSLKRVLRICSNFKEHHAHMIAEKLSKEMLAVKDPGEYIIDIEYF